MTAWRMAFRNGKNGRDLWPECKRRKIAIIQYGPMNDLDLSRYPAGEPADCWQQLWGPQKASLRFFAYDMKPGHTIYVKSGPEIVGRGVVDSEYVFNASKPLIVEGVPWQHQRRVVWDEDFPKIRDTTSQKIVTLKSLTPEDVDLIERQCETARAQLPRPATDSDLEGIRTEVKTISSSRSRKLRDRALFLANGVCTVCERDYSKILGGKGIRVLQVHHKNMLSQSKAPVRTTLGDLVVVCANCHLLLHLHSRKTLTVKQLKKMLSDDSAMPIVKGHAST